MTGLYVSNIYADESTMYIELREYTDINEYAKHNNMMSIKIPLELNRDIMKISKIPEIPNMASTYVSIEELPTNYNKEQAIADKCFVIEDYKIISDNVNQMDEFIKKTQENINACIRIYDYNQYNGKRIIDIEYKNGKYITAIYRNGIETIYSFSGNKIEISYNEYRQWYNIVVIDERTLELDGETEKNNQSQILTYFIK